MSQRLHKAPHPLRASARWWRQRWRRPTWRSATAVLLWPCAVVLAGLGAFALVTAGYATITGSAPPWGGLESAHNGCTKTGFACDITSTIFFTLAPIALTTAVFVRARFRRGRQAIVTEAKAHPRELVRAGEIVGEVVGRDDLCDALQLDLSHEHPRPQVLVGGVGSGKTAVLVRLTEQLARRGAVPVPIRLRHVGDNEEEIDFLQRARERFDWLTASALWTEAEREKVWRRLLKKQQLVVLADGLEEALVSDDGTERDRDHRIRGAVTQAHKLGYPLVIASRPHDALNALDAALVPLEPLSEEAATQRIAGVAGDPEGAIARIVETAEAVEAPLYLQIAHQLNAAGVLDADSIDTRDRDRMRLRVTLMQRWVDALISGRIAGPGEPSDPGVPLSSAQRTRTIDHVAALACCGLAHDTLEVGAHQVEQEQPRRLWYESLWRRAAGEPESASGTTRLPSAAEIQVQASLGACLHLVEYSRSGVRFPHSVMQAYLGSRLIGDALQDPAFRDDAFESPGRELLLALTLFSRAQAAAPDRYPDPPEGLSWPSWLQQRLVERAEDSLLAPDRRLDLLATAIEVGSLELPARDDVLLTGLIGLLTAPFAAVAPLDPTASACACAERLWHQEELLQRQDRATQDAKLRLIARLGAAARCVAAAAAEPCDREPAETLYRALHTICCEERSYPVRLAATQELGAGGEVAFAAIDPCFTTTMPDDAEPRRRRQRMRAALEHDSDERALLVQAWLLPLLTSSVDEAAPVRDQLERQLDRWLELVGDGMPLSVEMALAQGFKYAANRRPRNQHEQAHARLHLKEAAASALERTGFWFTRLTLLHALCLWRLSGTQLMPHDEDGERDYDAVVDRWLGGTSGTARADEHVFVREAAQLVVQALESGRPERYLWIDESGVAGKVGSRSGSGRAARGALWIPPSAGWLVLEPRARQLVADVLIELNLAERGSTARDRNRRLEQIDKPELPYCLELARCAHLMPKQIGPQVSPQEKCRSGCPVGLCPYPTKGQHPYRGELSETFCRSQIQLLARSPFRRRSTGPAPWQRNARKRDLKAFWEQMAARARV